MPKDRAGRATMKDVAALAGVSAKTVSNVLTGTAAVRPETQGRVEAAMRELDFVPNLSARGLRNGRSGVIAIALPDLATAFSAEMLHHLVDAAHQRGFAVQIEETATAPERERDLVSRARQHLVDGVVLNPIRIEDSVIDRDDRLPPVVLIGEVEQHVTDRVLVDSRAGARDAVAHLIERGARRIAAIGGDGQRDRATATSRLRLAGMHDALAAAGLEVDPRREINVLPWNMEAGAIGVRTLIERGVGFDAVLCFTDSIAVGALHALAAAGVRVPDDVLVCGFDDIEQSRYTTPELTTVSFDRDEFARATIALLEERITARGAPVRAVAIPHRVVVRGSTGTTPASSPSGVAAG
ncbi:LacI family DNA-binding transcriptional regulator [Microbacterium oleivorans]|uniref:LacI family DNA-binding transcriptional regulator n=1 Tax=Microbacterium oleivorans TaxID=273677 RepID=A0A7D5JY34_9MICO|nr:LacI family DNA-binding transcriptional regulator [Microbacterium oleivorans]QLD11503.1 LacI family DNA-binding transcriptional regulator [Microbacterium oleivorans]